tara:strand:- start:108 stop:3086 length:2979 start_codon:yes stop_codon:yes gene_type:complete
MATFSVNDQARRAVATANGSNDSFSFSFQVNATTDVKVYVDGTLKTAGSHYDIVNSSAAAGLNTDGTGVAKFTGGNVPANNAIVTILSDVPVARTSVYTAGGNITATSLEADLDTLTMVVGDREERDGRALTAPVNDAADVDMTLPAKDTRKGTVLGFNATSGNPEAGPTIADVSSLSAITADIAALADIEDGTTATDAISGVAAIASNVTTVAGIASNVTSVAGAITNINLLAPSDVRADMALLATTDVIADMALLATTDVIADMNTLATSDIVSDLNTLATSDIVSDINVLATSDIVSDLNTLATSDIVSDINTLATSDIVTDLNLLATSDFVSDLNTLATSDFVSDLNAVQAIASNVTTVADNSSNINTVASNISTISAKAPAAGSSDIVTTGALNSGSITSGFGTIDTGSSAITTTGVITGGTLEATADTSAGDNAAIGFTSAEGLILTGQGSTSDITFKNDADTTVFSIPTGTDDISFPDNAAILMGAGNDLKIFHNGSNSQINDLSTGNLQLLSNGAGVDVLKTDGEVMAKFITDGAVELYHNAVKKLETSASGVDITGALATSGQVQIGAYSPASDAILSAVDSGNGLEWGHANASGYRSTLGAFSGGGAPFIALSAEAGTNANTFRTRGIAGSVITTDNAGALVVQQVTTASADNQSGTERMRLDSSGNLLVGTTTNDIYDSTSEVGSQISDGYLAVARASTVAYFNRLSSDGEVVMFRKGGTTVGLISTYSGDLAIGTNNVGLRFIDSTDANALRIVPSNIGSSTDVDASLDLGMSSARFKDGYFSGTVFCVQIRGVSDTNTGIDVTGSDIIAFKTGGSERARITSGGRVGIGQSSPAGRLDVNNNGATTETLMILSDFGGTGAHTQISFNNTNGQVGTINTSGSATSFNTSSDRRLKSNIQDAASASSKIDAMQVRQFDWNADGSHQDYGLIAQELQPIEPMAVSGNADSDEMMGVDYSKLVPMLIKEIQELRSRVATLEAS